MERTGNDIKLLFPCKGNEFDGIAGYADRKVGIFRLFRMFHGIQKHFLAKDIHIQVMCPLVEITIEHMDQVLSPFSFIMTQGVRIHGLRIGNAIQGPDIGNLGYRIQRSQQAALFCTIAGIGTWCKGRPGPSAIRQVTCKAAIDDIGRNRQYRRSRFRIAVRMTFADIRNEFVEQPDADIVSPVIIVSIFREFTFDDKILSQAVFIADDLDLGIFYG